MKPSEIEIIIVKFLNKEANFNELEKLNRWLKNDKNTVTFNHFVKVDYLTTVSMGEYNVKHAKDLINTILKSIEKRRKRVIVLKRMAIAASILLIVGLSFFKFNHKKNKVEIVKISNKIETGSDKATLTLEDGSQIALEKGITTQTKNAKSNGEKIIYKKSDSKTSKIAYNYLTIPRGGQFLIKLSDGTQVWLNSESQLKYPVVFTKGKPRQVELIYGEAYFEVSPSTKHKGAKFRVINNQQEIEVLGTEFNIKAYKDETQIYTTLVDGKIALHYENFKKTLAPNQQSIIDLKNNTLLVKKIDVYNEISWKEGVFSFEGKSLKEIMKVLSRWYDLDVEFKNKDIEKEEFNGSLDKNQPIEEILSSIKNYGVIKNYHISNKKVILE